MSCEQTVWTPNGDAVYYDGCRKCHDASVAANEVLQLDRPYWIPPYRVSGLSTAAKTAEDDDRSLQLVL